MAVNILTVLLKLAHYLKNLTINRILNVMETASPKIFLVEDDIFYKETVKHTLAKSNFNNVRTFTNGADFLKAIETEKPDLVILDYLLGDTDGLKIFEKIKAISPGIPVVLISGQEKLEVITQAMNMGVFDYIQKDKTAFSKLKVIAMKTESELAKRKEERLALIYTTAVFVALGLIGVIYLILKFKVI
jgi:DNA-binding NtrC family response regulator